jgi:hypothetical protein
MPARGGVAGSARSARDAVVGNSSLRSYVWILGLAAVVSGVGLAVDGRVVPAAVLLLASGGLLWLAGGLALPGTPEAYRRRVAFVYRGWAGESQRSYDEFARRRLRRAREAERLDAPPRIVEALEAEEDAGLDRRPPLVERARHAAAVVSSIAEAPEELRSEVESDYRVTGRSLELATEKAVARLARLNPPEGSDGPHKALREAFETYLSVLRSFHAGDLDAAGLEEAADRLRERARACIRPSSAVHG